jgi:hypothetical protein
MNRVLIDKLAAALLYEGYVLYPYRPSVKNTQRWTFGGIYPQAWGEAQNGTEPYLMQTECLLEGSAATVRIMVRFLQLIERTVGKSTSNGFQKVDSLEIDEKRYQPWQEAIEREINLEDFSISDLLSRSEKSSAFVGDEQQELLRDSDGNVAGVLWRRRQGIAVSIEICATQLASDLYKLTVKIINRTPLSNAAHQSRDEMLLSSLISTHTILGIENGQFVSQTDPPSVLKEHAATCKNIGAWPVLVGTEPERDTILSSPIILSDYPEIAPESPGDLFDGLEIDEILTLRILTLTDEEKKTAAAMDERVGALLQRTEALARQQMMNLHGAIRGMKMVPEEQQP